MRRTIARKATIRKPARRATTNRRATTGKIWTATEISSLRKSYRSMPTRTIARQLKRTLSSVQTKARSLGLKKAANGSWMASPMKKKTTAKKTTARKSTAKKATRKTAAKGKKK